MKSVKLAELILLVCVVFGLSGSFLTDVAVAEDKSGAIDESLGCYENSMPSAPEWTSGEVQLPFDMAFDGVRYSSVWITNYGSITLAQPWVEEGQEASAIPTIIPYESVSSFIDGQVTYGLTEFDGRPAFCVTWRDVLDVASDEGDSSTYQVLLIDRNDDVGAGDFDLVMNYGSIPSTRTAGMGFFLGTAQSGEILGSGEAVGEMFGDSFYFVYDPGLDGALSDSNVDTGLIHNSTGTNQTGRHIYEIRHYAADPTEESKLVAAANKNFTRYVALGDSFQSGEGSVNNDKYNRGTNVTRGKSKNLCRRSHWALPSRLSYQRKSGRWPKTEGGKPKSKFSSFAFRACSGAKVADVYEGMYNETSQTGSVTKNTTLATIGIGGNDLGFGSIIKKCIGKVASGTCATQENEDEILKKLNALVNKQPGNKLSKLARQFANLRKKSKKATIVAFGYPRMFPTNPVRDCNRIGENEQRWLNPIIAKVNRGIQRSARAARVSYFSQWNALKNHELCVADGKDEWLNGNTWKTRESYHPTRRGQEAMWRNFLNGGIQSSSTSAGKTTVRSAQTTNFSQSVPIGVPTATFTVSWPDDLAIGSRPHQVSVRLVSPSGRIYEASSESDDMFFTSDDTSTTITVVGPEPGSWTVESTGIDVPADGLGVDISYDAEPPPNAAPEVELSVIQTGGKTVEASALGSTDSDGEIVEYRWDFGDGEIATGESASHAYTRSGIFDVTLTVYDDEDESSTKSVRVEFVDEEDKIDGIEMRLIGRTGCGGMWVQAGDFGANGSTLIEESDEENCSALPAPAVASGDRIATINSCSAPLLASGEIGTDWNETSEADCGSAVKLDLADDRVAKVDECGALALKLGGLNSEWVELLGCGGASSVSIAGIDEATDRIGVTDACDRPRVLSGSAGGWTDLDGCGTAKAVKLEGDRVAIVDHCNALRVKEGALDQSWESVLPCDTVRAFALADTISHGRRIAVIDECGKPIVKDGSLSEGWVELGECGDAAGLALIGNRIVKLDLCGAISVIDGAASEPWQEVEPCESAVSVATNCANGGSCQAMPIEPDTEFASGPSEGDSVAADEVSFGFAADNHSSDTNATFECRLDDDVDFAECPSPLVLRDIAEGQHTVEVRAIDRVGNVDTTPAVRTFRVSTQAPETFIEMVSANPLDSDIAVLQFSASEEADFYCKVDDGDFAACPANGEFTGLTPGNHEILAYAVDSDGNADETPASASLSVDTHSPNLEVDGPEIEGTSASFSWMADEEITTYSCAIDGEWDECSSPVQLNELAPGNHSFWVVGSDAAGNLSEPTGADYVITGEIELPKTTIDSGPENGAIVEDGEVTFEFSSLVSDLFECSLDDSEFVACSTPITYSELPSGEHSFAVRARGDGGFTDPVPSRRQFTVDLPGPDVNITSPEPGETIGNDHVELLFTHSDDAISVTCQLDLQAVDEDCESPKLYVFDEGDLQNGQHELKVTATDNLGRSTAASVAFTVAGARPNTSITGGPTGDIVVGESATYSFESDDAFATFECGVSNAYELPTEWVPCTSPFSTPPATQRGDQVFSVRAKNAFGVLDDSPEMWTQFAYQPLPVEIVSGPSVVSADSKPRFVLGSLAHGRYNCQIDNDPPVRDCLTFGPPLPDFQLPTLPAGEHTFQVWSTDGTRSSEPTVRSFIVDPGSVAPETVLDHVPPALMNGATASQEYFAFQSSLPNSRFECRRKLIGPGFPNYGEWLGWLPCSSPVRLNRLSEHFVFEVRAVSSGAVDATPLSYEVNVDISAPEPYIISGPDGATDDSTPSFEFEVQGSEIDLVADHFMCSVDSGPFELCSSPFTLSELSDGPHSFAVWAYDEVGNVGRRNGYRSFIVGTGGIAASDTVPPDTYISLPTPYLRDGLYEHDTHVVQLAASEPATYECSIDDAPFESCDVDWLIFPDPGIRVLKVRATDMHGNLDPTPVEETITIDGTAPAVEILSPANGAKYSSSSVPIDIEVSESSESLCLTDDFSGILLHFNCHESLSELQFAEGDRQFLVMATDFAGNQGQAASSFTVELPPDTTIDSGPGADDVLTETQAEFSFTSEPGASFECRMDSESYVACSSPHTTGVLSPGQHTFYVRAIDSDGVADPTPARRDFSVVGSALSFDENAGLLSFEDRAGIRNDLLVDLDGDELVIHDAESAFLAPPLCYNVDPNTVRCPFASIVRMVIDVGAGDDRVVVRAPVDVVVYGGEADDTIITDLADELHGGTGDDLLDGGPGPDLMAGGPGNDTVTYANRVAPASVSLDGIANDGEAGEGDNVADDVENIIGGQGDDVFNGSDAPNRIEGGPGNDTIDGKRGPDQMLGQAGDDTIRSRNGLADVVSCGDGDDYAFVDPIDGIDGSCEAEKTTPETSITFGPNEDESISNSTPTFGFASDESEVGFRCRVDDLPVVDCGAQYSTPALEDGAHRLEVAAIDFFGNQDPTPTTRHFTVDTVPPMLSIVSPSTGQHIASSDIEIEFVDDGTGLVASCQVDGEPAQPCSSPFTVSLDDGQHTVSVSKQDLAQNLSTDSVAFTIDTQAPTVSVMPLASSPTNDATPEFSVSANDLHIATVVCEVDDSGATPCGSLFTAPQLTEGSHSVSVVARDIAGNQATDMTELVVDLTPPITTLDGPSGLQTDSTPTYQLTASEAGVTFQCKLDQGAFMPVGSPYTAPDLVEGTHTITCRSVDEAGNIGPSSSKTTTIGSAYSDPKTTTVSGGWGALCTPLDFALPLGCPSGIISHTIPARPSGLAGNYQVNISGWVDRICSLVGVGTGYTIYLKVDGSPVASQYKSSTIDFFCLRPVWLSATKLNLSLSSATSHTISMSVKSSLQLSAFPSNSGSGLTVDIGQL